MVQAINEVVTALQSLVRVAGVTEDELVTLSLISDLSYAWVLVDDYTPIMQVCWMTVIKGNGIIYHTTILCLL